MLPQKQARMATTFDVKHVFETRSTENFQDRIRAITSQAENLYTEIEAIQTTGGNAESERLVECARRSLEETFMWAMKAVSRL